MAQQTTGVPDPRNQARKEAREAEEANPFHPDAMTDQEFDDHLDSLLGWQQGREAVRQIGRLVRENLKGKV